VEGNNHRAAGKGGQTDGYTFKKRDRLKKRSEYLFVSKAGKKVTNRYFIALFVNGRFSWPRIGITVTRRVGNAVTRNRVKRMCREFFRLNREHLDRSVDINLIAKKETAALPSETARRSLTQLFEQINRKSGF